MTTQSKQFDHSKQFERLVTVVNRIVEMCTDNENDTLAFSEVFDDMLDDLAADDFFGTEGSTDPRGDMREGSWSMFRVDGVDE